MQQKLNYVELNNVVLSFYYNKFTIYIKVLQMLQIGGILMKKLVSKGIVKVGSFMNMNNRVNYFKVSPVGMENVMLQEKYVNKIKMDRKLIPLVKLYISLLNGCSYCIELHYKEAVKKKVEKKYIDTIINLDIENEIFNNKEKTILLFSKKLTLITEHFISDEDYLNMRKYLSEKEYIDFILLINQVNTWNRISIGSGNIGNEIDGR